MSTKSNIQTVNENIFTQGMHLQERLKYKELNPTEKYDNCNVLFINHDKKTFWFTTTKTLEHTNKLNQ